ncbi:protein of unknown function [Candidatus Nitrospira inopinata]|uniref:Uncharacterized protein n=1 Tax=Candidatus Nitrospira inopinata TaxID=1715989 RepID=A0A0S4KMA9_9BACT|nr:protein of unknown function [Candidatus Nitrospira inopinata]
MRKSAGSPDRVTGQGYLLFYCTTAEFNDIAEQIMPASSPFTFPKFPLQV